MTPRLRSFFEQTVEPALEVVRYREELTAKDKTKAHWQRLYNEETDRRNKARAALKKETTGSKAHKKAEGSLKYYRKQVAKKSTSLANSTQAVSQLRAKIAQLLKQYHILV